MSQVCPSLLSTGACGDAACRYKHDVRICNPCGVICISDNVYQAHLRGRRHRNKISGASTTYYCDVCNVSCFGLNVWNQHTQGRRHQSRALLSGASNEAEPGQLVTSPGLVQCDICELSLAPHVYAAHLRGRRHRLKERFLALKSALSEGEKDKNGVTVSHLEGGIDFGVVRPELARTGTLIRLTLSCNVPGSNIVIREHRFTATARRTLVIPFTTRIEGPETTLRYNRPINLNITLASEYQGRYEDRLEITFEDVTLRTRFIIVRTVRAVVSDPDAYESLQPTAPYVPRRRNIRQREAEVIPGEKPDSLKVIPWVVPLPEAEIPKSMADGFATGNVRDQVALARSAFLPAVFNETTYGRHFKALLWIEEMRMEHDLEIYDMDNARLSHTGRLYFLDVPGLAEKRPSVLVGDSIHVHRHGSPAGKWFAGRVHRVRMADVGLGLNSSFRADISDVFDVHFKLNRYPIRRQHQALDTAFHEPRVLFPTASHLKAQLRLSSNVLEPYFNSLIGGNAAQVTAVTSIVSLSPGSPPFVVFGPPGTGKTITIIEAIRQILLLNPDARILACAPSNSAADLIATRLSALGEDRLFRMYAPSRSRSDVPDALLPFTYSRFANAQAGIHATVADAGDRHFGVPIMSRMRRYRVVVSTCVSASVPHGIGMLRGHFTHIFVDEAGQASEPEVMIPIKTMADTTTNVILSGDHKQLGPIIRSPIARELGLETSYLERLMDRPIYEPLHINNRSVVKLVRNYRSHDAILSFPNDKFYNGDLIACGAQDAINRYLGWSGLPNPKFPIIFHALRSKDDREASSPSFFNVLEVLEVKNYVSSLRSDRRYRTMEDDIGIITPYHAQCKKIRASLKGFADTIKVGSVEEFQGQERSVIVVSTVRSSLDQVQYDLRHTLGFVANPRRFNVTVTRAKALLIVVGDPEVLSLDPLWRAFLNYVYNNGGWKGPAGISWDPNEDVRPEGGYDRELQELGLADINELTRRIENITLRQVTEEAVGEETVDANVNRPWVREAE